MIISHFDVASAISRNCIVSPDLSIPWRTQAGSSWIELKNHTPPCAQVRRTGVAWVRRPAFGRRQWIAKQLSVSSETGSPVMFGGNCVLSPPTVHDNSLTVEVARPLFHGEFDPGSGRTLAACLTHASGATNLLGAKPRTGE